MCSETRVMPPRLPRGGPGLRQNRCVERPGQEPAPRAVLAVLLLAATLGAGLLGTAITDQAQVTAAWWPAAGVGLVALLLLPSRTWPAMMVGLSVAYLLTGVLNDSSMGASTCLA